MTPHEKRTLYDELAAQLAALLEGESDPIANAANTAALIYHGLPDLNWAGFYFVHPSCAPSPACPHPFPPPPAGEGEKGATSPFRPPQVSTAEKIEAAAQLSPPPLAGEGQGGGKHASGLRELVLGPFQGKPACVRIPWGQGVCGTAAVRGEAVIVPDVHEFPGHIACDPNSRSELVIPLVRSGEVVGVLDLDSPVLARFDETDRLGCERLVAILIASLGPE
ncbi:MAG: GAF domain-containing protein [Alphaproteobacteria bacterium]